MGALAAFRSRVQVIMLVLPGHFTAAPARRVPSQPGRFMQRYYPSSFLMLTLVGFSLVALPLLFGLVYSALSVAQVANQSKKAVHQAVQATQATRILIEQITAMERRFRQFIILNDDALLDGFEVAHERFLAESEALEELVPDAPRRQVLNDLIAAESALHARVQGARGGNPESLAEAVADFAPLATLARTITQQGSDVVDREVLHLQEMAEQAQQRILWQLLALGPVVLFLVIGFTVLIAKPIRQIEGAIRKLGEADFASEIKVDGPADLEYLGRRLDWMRRRLLELEAQKTRFLHHVSHELKTPLTALKEGAELLAEGAVGPLSPEQCEVVEILRGNGRELQRLIEDLLAYQALQAAQSGLNLSRFPLRPLLERVAEKHQLALRSRAVILELACPDMMLEADEAKIAIIFDNLLSNAIKFSPDGKTVRVVAVQSGDRLTIEVRDAGPGLAEEEREKVFEAFFRGRRAPHQRIKGTGLGLSIVKEFVSAHGGNIEVRNVESGGACFRVTLPRLAGGLSA
jgi:two-component system sensor histidine kinase GlrK